MQAARAAAPAARVMAVVKANAYGHGLELVTAALHDADGFAVARLDEAVAIRQSGTRRRVLVLEGPESPEELADARRYSLDLVIHNPQQLGWVEPAADGLAIWLKLDSGMHRLGFMPEQFAAAVTQLRSYAPASVTLMTHLASADLRDDPMTEKQLAEFAALLSPGDQSSVANSAGVLAWPDARAGWVRPGIMLYGISPFAGQTGIEFGLQPAMHFCTKLLAIRPVRAGETVGYCGTWTASRDTIIGTAAVGYGDGYPGNLPGGTPVLVNGRRCELAGRVSMDLITIDLGPGAGDEPGADVTLWGNGLAVEEIADRAGRLAYEVVCGVSQRVPRISV
ncbi:MAG: alanine racemase [Gammaproteobacteria bacterium]|nr:alanine racemase [Gammaproteobacteria bacterium]